MQSTSITLEEILARHNWIPTFTHPSGVASLLLTNEASSPLQSVQLRASLEGIKTALTELQSDLDLLHNATASLQTQISRLQSFENDYKTALSPIRRIPSEITMEILHRSLDSRGLPLGVHVLRLGAFTIQHGPWRLGQVCSSWRNVIETLCLELWATVKVVHRFPYKLRLKGNLAEMLRVVLERSCNHPLDFNLEFRDSGMEERDIQEIERCFDAMIVHSKRWRAVNISIPSSFIP
ncbi:hypothetical protein DFS33DRAFT_1081048 [Desarmillaria ectypa]|nr:hypothetical protein DFS33DRAFT_1081048 [Desarmillaria ectypa]